MQAYDSVDFRYKNIKGRKNSQSNFCLALEYLERGFARNAAEKAFQA